MIGLRRLRLWEARAWRALAGDDGPDRRTLPVSELLAPLPLAAATVLVVNDWLLKPSAAPGWLTGKLSDVAGLVVAPLVVTAGIDLVLYAAARVGARVDFTLRAWKLAAAAVAVGGLFAASKLSPTVAATVASALAGLFGRAAIVADASDLFALPALVVAFWHGRRALARVAAGRLELVARRHGRGRPLAAPFSDAAAAGADPAAVAELDDRVATWLAGGDPLPVRAALDRLRGDRPAPRLA